MTRLQGGSGTILRERVGKERERERDRKEGGREGGIPK
jgi:hypothetical protein